MSIPRTRAEQKRHTRALIVGAGREAVATRGFSGLVVRELAREAGIVPTAFYRHFESVDDLASELAVGAADALASFIDELISTATDDPVTTWPRLATAAATRDPQTWAMLARGLVDTAHPDHRVLAAAVDSARRRLGITLGRLETLAGADDTSVDIAADLVVVVLLRVLLEVAVGDDERSAVDGCAGRLRIILAGAATGS
ncbi:TetR/AcrR family transcriptional regulator [Dietzia sp. ANT_WB102]|uniref:TetR/AcrR family transcriptional regulator n=1 Tax=Dietzia sp. ANT_WB102 TaxID=2597345 RepID=UPI0011EEA1E3|nr:TetR/AcrR family transcriptional regulator [Dietzia sp. ANT_WB102]KAA0916989.1 TetR family transcriptional regulator [Dietzia sp. ANT_WB102]